MLLVVAMYMLLVLNHSCLGTYLHDIICPSNSTVFSLSSSLPRFTTAIFYPPKICHYIMITSSVKYLLNVSIAYFEGFLAFAYHTMTG
jgi:hypothetical protein